MAFGEHRPQKDLQVSFNNKRKHSRSGITPETTFGSRVKDRLLMKSLKYCLIEIAEAMSDILQHILANKKGIAADGYVDVAVKAKQNSLISSDLMDRLLFFFKFRNVLVHRYWQVDDEELLKNTRQGGKDFEMFANRIDRIISVNMSDM